MKIKRPFSRGEPTFFRKAEDGTDVFYPWGYGDAFYLNGDQKRKVRILMILLYGALEICTWGPIILWILDIIPFNIFIYISAGAWIFFPALYLIIIRCLSQKLAPFSMSPAKRIERDDRALTSLLWGIPVAVSFLAVVVLSDEAILLPVRIILASCSVGYGIMMYTLIKRILMAKGHWDANHEN